MSITAFAAALIAFMIVGTALMLVHFAAWARRHRREMALRRAGWQKLKV